MRFSYKVMTACCALATVMAFVANQANPQSNGGSGGISYTQMMSAIQAETQRAQAAEAAVTASVPNVSSLATQTALNAAIATIPTPASTAPPMDTATGSAGTPGSYSTGNAVRPSLVRRGAITLDNTGSATATWSTPLAAAPDVQVTPRYSGSGVPKCWTVAGSATVTQVQIKCVVEGYASNLTLSALTLAATVGLSLNPNSTSSASGMMVDYTAGPPM